MSPFLPLPPVVGGRVRLAGFAGCGDALALADWLPAQGRPALFVARDALDAAHLLEELSFFAPSLSARLLPDWDVLPYDSYSPTAEVAAARIVAFAALLDGAPGLTITTAAALLSPAPPPSFIAARAFHLRVGDRLDLPSLLRRLERGGYARVDRVLSAGEFAVYGGQADIFPPEEEKPFRLVMLDDEIEQIRLFSPDTQRSVERVGELRVLPMSECDISADGVARFRAAFSRVFAGDEGGDICRRVVAGERVSGVEFYLPLFFDRGSRVFDYLAEDCLIVARRDMRESAAAFLRQARMRRKIVGAYENRPALPVSELFLGESEFSERLRSFSLMELGEPLRGLPPSVVVNPRAPDSHRDLSAFIRSFEGNVIIAVDGKGRRDSLAMALSAAGVSARQRDSYAECGSDSASLVVAPLRGGVVLPAERLAVLTEAELFQTPLPPRSRRHHRAADAVLHPGDILPGELVVHREHGVGRARGLKNMAIDGEMGEFFEIEYADSQRLFLPVSQLQMLERHQGGVELSKMGGAGWRRARRRAERRAYDSAARLLEINARRAAASPRPRIPDEEMLAKFVAAFAYPETPDQEKAAAAALIDLRSPKPMDRLIAADVGFGKTEVAMRAVAAVVFSGAQAAVLAPTTLLAEQHYRAFSDRFAGFPARIESLTRLTPPGDRRRALSGLESGETDIVIGTHALLRQSARYKNLGLAVIDEEHRFGVRDKERFKKMRADIDLLALSATPIPRTLAMAFGGVRDLSVISTPPAGRLSVKTVVAPFSHAVIAEACERELLRGGQVFFVHNEIRSIAEMAEKAGEWLPGARIIVAHGGMAAPQLTGAMRRFLRREADILLCTTIVESGLDVANANTIIVNRADKMGLSRLHQLRGRVGRAGAQAYAYFLTPAEFAPTKRAEARLAAATDYTALGGGFFLSMRDLEIRGAGEILGEKQSGDMEAVGCAMYQRMVSEAAKRLRGESDVESDISAIVSLPAPALLPAEYVPSPGERMRYYRQLAAAPALSAIDDIAAEWQDRFGAPPAPAELLAESHRLRLAAAAVSARQIRVGGDGEAVLRFAEDLPCADQLLQKIKDGECHPATNNAVKVSPPAAAADPLTQARQLTAFLRGLASPPPPPSA